MGNVFVHIGDWMTSPRLLTTEEIERVISEALSGDTQFEVGDRIIDPVGRKGTVEDVVEKDDKMKICVVFDEMFNGIAVPMDPIVSKIRKIQ
ncbi:MAG: hypothetical protein PHU34_04720 [Candidatus Methanoperedens sp.]|nr:hypothetical protein [Candidatus Methanoperedens sp.]